MTPARCFFPNCVLEEHETGEHKFGRPEKPWGELRLILTACPVYTTPKLGPCDLHFPTRAVAFYADMLGFGWALCVECARKFSTTEVTEEHRGNHEQKMAETGISRRAHSDAPATHHAVESAKKSSEAEAPPTPQNKVIPFRPESKSQKLKAGVS
jgi:hypothetical protein